MIFICGGNHRGAPLFERKSQESTSNCMFRSLACILSLIVLLSSTATSGHPVLLFGSGSVCSRRGLYRYRQAFRSALASGQRSCVEKHIRNTESASSVYRQNVDPCRSDDCLLLGVGQRAVPRSMQVNCSGIVLYLISYR